MGKIKQGAYGGFSGKVGNLVGASWRGISYLRIMPASVANPKTPGQVNQRTKFAAVSQFLRANAAIVELGFKSLASRMTGRNAASSYLLKNAISGTAPNFSVDPALALLSRGNLAKAENAEAEYNLNEVTVTWDNNSARQNAQTDDEALLVVYNAEQGESLVEQAATRADGTGSISIPSFYLGDSVDVYVLFREVAGKKRYSDSVYAGSVSVS